MGRRREALIARRVHLDYTQESLAHRLNVATATVTKWEHGTRLPAPGIRRNLAEALEVGLIDLDRLLGIEPPIELNGHRVPGWLSHYDSLVLEAGSVGKIEKSSLPGLLQTKAYAAAIEPYGPVQLSDSQVIERVDQRIARQSVLYRQPEPLVFTAMIAEQLVNDVVGDHGVMVEQLDHLIDLAERPNIDLRILPADGRAACALGGFELLAKPGEVAPFMVVSFSVGRVHYDDDPLIIERFSAAFAYVASAALTPSESARRIEAIRETYR